MKLLFSYFLYYIGDIISLTTLKFGYGYSIYRLCMIWSCDLDPAGKLWKHVKPKAKSNRKKKL